MLQVTGLSEKLVREIAESMQVLRYPANGGHYSCHHDSVARLDWGELHVVRLQSKRTQGL